MVVMMWLVIAVLCYLFHPLLISPSPTTPENCYSDDKISWTYYLSPDNPNVYQKFSLFQDGSNEVEITRELGDFDVEMLGPPLFWSPTTNQETSITTFKKKNIVDIEKSTKLFQKAIESGVMDITDEPSSVGGRLVIDIKVGLVHKSVSGPDFLSSPVAFPPWKWKNRIFWQKLSNLINQDSQLKPLMDKLTYLDKK